MPLEDFVFHERIGSGSYSEVFKVTRKVDKKQYVIKQIKLGSLSRSEQEMCIKECKILSGFEHPFIVRYYESFISRENGGLLNIVMEICATNLGDFLIKRKDRKANLDEKVIWRFFIQILISLAQIHESRIIHRDVKPMNIFLDSSNNVKIGDFGVSKQLGQQSLVARTLVGTPYYLSPELCKNEPYTAKADVWALGCILYELIELRHPFQANNHAALIMNIVKGTFKPINSRKYSNELAYVVQKCLRKDQQYRYTTSQLLSLTMVQEHGRKLNLYHLFPEKNQKVKVVSKTKKNHHRNNQVNIPPLKLGKARPRISPPSGRKGGNRSPSNDRKKVGGNVSPRRRNISGNVSPGRVKGNVSPKNIMKMNQMEVLSDKDVIGAPSTISPRKKKSPQLSPMLKQMISPRKKNGGKSKSSNNNNNNSNRNNGRSKGRRIVPSLARIGPIPKNKGRAGNHNSSPPRRRVKIDPKIRKRNKGSRMHQHGYQIDWTKNQRKVSPAKQRPSKIIQAEDPDDVKSVLRGPSKTNLMIVSNPFDVVHEPLFSMKRRKTRQQESEKSSSSSKESSSSTSTHNKNNKNIERRKKSKQELFNLSPDQIPRRKRKKSNSRKHKYQKHKRNKSTGSNLNHPNKNSETTSTDDQSSSSSNKENKKETLSIDHHHVMKYKKYDINPPRRRNEKKLNIHSIQSPKKNTTNKKSSSSSKNVKNHIKNNKPKDVKNQKKNQKKVRKRHRSPTVPIFEVIDEDVVRNRVESEKIKTMRTKEEKNGDKRTENTKMNTNNEKDNSNENNDDFTVHIAQSSMFLEEEPPRQKKVKKKNHQKRSEVVVVGSNIMTKRKEEEDSDDLLFVVNRSEKRVNPSEEEPNFTNLVFSDEVNMIEDDVRVNHLSTRQFEDLSRLGSEFEEIKNLILGNGVEKAHFDEIFQFMKNRPRAEDSIISKFILERIDYEKSHVVDSFHSLVLIDKDRTRIMEKL